MRTSTCCSRRLISESSRSRRRPPRCRSIYVDGEVERARRARVEQRVDQRLHAPGQAPERLELRPAVLVEPSGVVLDEESCVVVDAAQRLLQVVRGDVGEVVELPVASPQFARCALRARARRDGARRAPGTAQPCARPPVPRAPVWPQQLGVAALDLLQHVVECCDQHPNLVFSVWRRPQPRSL